MSGGSQARSQAKGREREEGTGEVIWALSPAAPEHLPAQNVNYTLSLTVPKAQS